MLQRLSIHKPDKGYTLIELTMAITMLGVITAAGLPRVAELPQDLRVARLKMLHGNMHSASVMVHARFLTNPNALDASEPAGNGSLNIGDGISVALVNGYPAATLEGINYAIGGKRDEILQGFEVSGGGNHAGAIQIWRIADAPNPMQCSLVYQASAAPNVSPVISDIVTGGC